METLKYYYNIFFNNNSNFENTYVKTKSIHDSFDYLSKRITQKERLFFVRFGDGEFITLLKQDHRNYVYNEGLEKELEASFKIKDNNYLISCPINYPYDEFHAKGVYKQFSWQEDMINLMRDKDLGEEILYENPCVFQCMTVFKPKKVKFFLDAYIRPKVKMFIGSTPKEVAEKLYGKINYYVKIPKKNAYETINEWWPEIEKYAHKVELVIPSAGSTSNVISIRLWQMNVNCKLIDFGSIVDAVDGKTSRTWIRLQGHKAYKLLNEKPNLETKQRLVIFLKDVKFFFRNQII